MISTVTTTTTSFTTYDLYIVIWTFIVILASFVYYYIKTKEYRGVILGSVVIGVILGIYMEL